METENYETNGVNQWESATEMSILESGALPLVKPLNLPGRGSKPYMQFYLQYCFIVIIHSYSTWEFSSMGNLNQAAREQTVLH